MTAALENNEPDVVSDAMSLMGIQVRGERRKHTSEDMGPLGEGGGRGKLKWAHLRVENCRKSQGSSPPPAFVFVPGAARVVCPPRCTGARFLPSPPSSSLSHPLDRRQTLQTNTTRGLYTVRRIVKKTILKFPNTQPIPPHIPFHSQPRTHARAPGGGHRGGGRGEAQADGLQGRAVAVVQLQEPEAHRLPRAVPIFDKVAAGQQRH